MGRNKVSAVREKYPSLIIVFKNKMYKFVCAKEGCKNLTAIKDSKDECKSHLCNKCIKKSNSRKEKEDQ